MPIASMTGFTRVGAEQNGRTWTWEIKSVNGRGFDVKFRLPAGYDDIEGLLRRQIMQRVRRGSLTVALQVSAVASLAKYQLNHDYLRQISAMVADVQQATGALAPTADGILALRGVIEEVREDTVTLPSGALLTALQDTFDGAIQHFQGRRLEEGRHLRSIVADLLFEIETLMNKAKQLADLRPASLRERLRVQLAEILDVHALPEEKLAHELALLAIKSDIREELDRIRAHIGAARQLIDGEVSEGAGRQLDFLAQEFGREVNTLCAKSGDLALTQTGLALKLAVDRLREQVQNIE